MVRDLEQDGLSPTELLTEEGVNRRLDALEELDRLIIELRSDGLGRITAQLKTTLGRLRTQRRRLESHPVFTRIPEDAASFLSPLGDQNLILDKVELTKETHFAILREIALTLITQAQAMPPTKFILTEFRSPPSSPGPNERVVVAWDVKRPIDMTDLEGIAFIAQRCYEKKITGPKPNFAGWETEARLRDATADLVRNHYAIYCGPTSLPNYYSAGLWIARRFRVAKTAESFQSRYPYDWICRSTDDEPNKNFRIELREGGSTPLAQDNFLMLVVQLAYFLQYRSLIDWRSLALAAYHALSRKGFERDAKFKPFGLESVLETIERVVLLPLQQPIQAKQYNLRPESVLLAGVTGTGKSLLSRYLVFQELNCTIVSVSCDAFLSQIGQKDEANLIFKIERIAQRTGLPVIIVVDDIEALMNTEHQDELFTAKMLNLLQGIRDLGFIVIAATNFPERIDPRSLQPGRFSRVIHVPLPDLKARQGMLEYFCTDLPFVDREKKQKLSRPWPRVPMAGRDATFGNSF